MTYPVIVICIALGITTFLIVKVVPVFGEIFADFGAKLPAPTQFLLDLSAFMRGYWWVIVGAIVGAFFGIRTLVRTERGRQTLGPVEAQAAGLRPAGAQDLR